MTPEERAAECVNSSPHGIVEVKSIADAIRAAVAEERPMTPEELASLVVMEFYGKRAWGYDPNQHAEYERMIADAIRTAVAAERERCVKIADEYKVSELAVSSYGIWHACDAIADAIRGGAR
jgi:hypothetical protein